MSALELHRWRSIHRRAWGKKLMCTLERKTAKCDIHYRLARSGSFSQSHAAMARMLADGTEASLRQDLCGSLT